MPRPEPYAVMIAKEAAALAALVVFCTMILTWADILKGTH